MLKRARTLLFIGTSLLCHTVSGCSKADPTATLPLTLRIADAEEKWRAANIRSYSFNSRILCFCVDEYGTTKRVTIRSGVVAQVVDSATGASVPLTWRQPVESLFVLLRREALDLPSRLEVSFDAKLGYPRRISYGAQEVDGGGVIVVENLRELP